MKRIILLATVGAVVALMMVASFLAEGSAQEEATAQICAPWSKAWDLSQGDWYYQWYRWC